MKRHSGLVVILAVLLGVSGALAQTSQVTVMLLSGTQHLLRNDYEGTPNSLCLSNLIGGQVPPGSQFMWFDESLQQYRPTVTRVLDGGWGPAGTTVLTRGKAFWIRIPPLGGLVASSQYAVTFSGDIPTNATTVHLDPGYNAYGYPFPVTQYWTNTQVAKSVPSSSMLLVWQPTMFTFQGYPKTRSGWSAGALTLTPGQGVFVALSSVVATNILEPRPY